MNDRGELRRETSIHDLVPVPVSVRPSAERFLITPQTVIVAEGEAMGVAEYLADLLRAATSYPVPVRTGPAEPPPGSLLLTSSPDDAGLGSEGYAVAVAAGALTIEAPSSAGLFYGVQTLRQLLARRTDAGEWSVPGGRIRDYPRFGYRGVMLDVARHFFSVRDIKRLIDLAALHKVNHLHLHLTDDQGWRIAIDTWPRLTSHGGGTEVGDGPGGYYPKAAYREIVEHAQRRFITVVPEVDLPGHTNAALASYPELCCDSVAPPRYTGVEVGFSSLCVQSEVTYRFLDDVFGELARLTPGPYLHIGGDEAKTLSPDAYAIIVGRAQEIVAAHGKTAIGWHEIAAAKLLASTVVQYWGVEREATEVSLAAAHGTRVIMSPANHTYLDMKYDAASPIGQAWAGFVDVQTAYDWDPEAYLHDLEPAGVLGVEGPLWTETVRTMAEIEYLALPRLAAVAEIGWSPASSHDWADFRARLAAQARLWRALDVNFYTAPQIPWVPA